VYWRTWEPSLGIMIEFRQGSVKGNGQNTIQPSKTGLR
jgi:hypothetical protein